MTHLVPCPGCGRHVRVTESACPFCNVMMTDGVKDMDKVDTVRVLDLAELVAESLPAAPPPPAKTE